MPEQREEGALVRTSSCQILPQSLHKAKENLEVLVAIYPLQRQECALFCKHQDSLALSDLYLIGVTLTHDGQNHNHEVKNVPPDGEIIVPQGEHLQHTLTGEEDDKHQVDPVKDVLHLLALCVCLHHHGHHVEANEHHDDYIKCLLSNKVKDSSLNAVLCNRREAMNQTSLNKNLPLVNKLFHCWWKQR